MTQLMLELPESLHQQLEGLAQREGVALTQYILYLLTRQVGSAYSVQVMSDASVAQQEADYQALRHQWGQASPAEVEAVLAKREVVTPEPELKPETIKKLRQRIESKQRGDS